MHFRRRRGHVNGGGMRHELGLLLPVEHGRGGKAGQSLEGQRGDVLVRRGEEVAKLRNGIENHLVGGVAEQFGKEAEDGPDRLGCGEGDGVDILSRFGLPDLGGTGRSTAARTRRALGGSATDEEEVRVVIKQMGQSSVNDIERFDPLVQIGLSVGGKGEMGSGRKYIKNNNES